MSALIIPNPYELRYGGATDPKLVIMRKNTYTGFFGALMILTLLSVPFLLVQTLKKSERSVVIPTVPIDVKPRVLPNTSETKKADMTVPTKSTVLGAVSRAGDPIPVAGVLENEGLKKFADWDDIPNPSKNGGNGDESLDNTLGNADRDNIVIEPSVESDPYIFLPVEIEPYIDLGDVQRKMTYPELARKAHVEGKVVVRVLVGADGRVKKHIVEQTESDLLTNAAVQALVNAVFTPARQNKQTVECWVSIPIVFKLQ